MEESSTYRAIVQKGELQHATRMLLSFGEKHFGSPSEQVRALLMSMEDLDQLDALCDRIEDVSSWEELIEEHST